jgi:hypothetical protein
MFISQDEVLALIFLAIFLQTRCSQHLLFPWNIMLTYSSFRYLILIHDQNIVRACTLPITLKESEFIVRLYIRYMGL